MIHIPPFIQFYFTFFENLKNGQLRFELKSVQLTGMLVFFGNILLKKVG